MKVTFVCLGNICRSPMAEFIAKDLVIKNNISVTIDSCGTSSYHMGEDMHIGTKRLLISHNIACEGFSSKPINQDIFDSSNYILVMDNSNYQNIINTFGNNDKVKKIIEYCDFEYDEVPDPWYTNDFNETYKILNNAISNFLKIILI